MKLTPSQKEKRVRNRLKNSVRAIGRISEKVKRGKTGELELFKRIAKERVMKGTEKFGYGEGSYVKAKHILTSGTITEKIIPLTDLTVTNFSHIVSKGRDKTKRLDPDNIEIVSRAYHEWQHSLQIPQTNYIN